MSVTMPMNAAISILGICLIATACPAASDPAAKSPKAQAFKDGRLVGKESILAALEGREFISWNGKLQGVDSDYMIRFKKDGSLTVRHQGIEPMTIAGTFTIQESTGEITLAIKEAGVWPKIVVAKKNGKVLLQRADSLTHFAVPADWGGKGEPSGVGFWPFAEGKAP